MTPRTVEAFAQRIEAMGFALEGLRLPSRSNPDAFHEHKSELKREWRRLAVEFRNTFGAPQRRSVPNTLKSGEKDRVFGR